MLLLTDDEVAEPAWMESDCCVPVSTYLLSTTDEQQLGCKLGNEDKSWTTGR
jgi:hypothetical protein